MYVYMFVCVIGVVTTFAGSTRGSADGAGAAARFNGPTGVAVDTLGMYVCLC